MQPDKETQELMNDYDLDVEDADPVKGLRPPRGRELKGLMDELGLDADDALDLMDEL